MEFIFVRTQEFKEFEQDIKRTIKFIKKNAIKSILGGLLFYLLLCLMIIIL